MEREGEQGGEEQQQLGKGVCAAQKPKGATISVAAGDYSRRLNPVSIKRS